MTSLEPQVEVLAAVHVAAAAAPGEVALRVAAAHTVVVTHIAMMVVAAGMET